MRLRLLAAAAVLSACASAATAPDKATAAQAEPGLSVLVAMRTVRARVRRGEAPAVHAELAKQMREHPNDALPRFLDTVAEMPSDVAWQHFKQQAMDAPQDPWPQIAMAMIYSSWAMFPQAEQSLAKAESLRPGFLPVALARAQLLQKQSDPGAKAAFQAVLARADLPEAHAGLGELALAAGDLPTARQELGLAAKGDAASLEVQQALGKLALDSRDDAAALTAYQAIVAMSPTDTKALEQLAKLEEATGDLAGARRDFNKVAETHGIDLETAKHLVSLARKANDGKALVAALTTLASVDKDRAAPEVELAQALAAQKDPVGAEAAYKAALQREPKNAQVELALARLYRDGQHNRQAIEAYQAALALPNPPAEAKAELDPLVAALELPAKPIAGDVNRINDRFTADLNRFYKQRLKSKPGLKGTLRIAVEVGADGKVANLAVTPTGIDDELLIDHAYFTMKGAQFPHAKRSPVFEVELRR